MALFRVSNNRAQFDAAGNDASDQYGAGIRFTQGGNARVTTATPTNYNQGIPMSATGQVAIVDATAGLPAGTIFHNGLPISGDKVCVSRNATAVVSNGTPYDSAGAVAADINLDLNFIGTDTLNSSVTFTRASTGTFFNSAGVLTSAAINAPRFDYNPATLAAQGLLIEEQRTNSIRNNTMQGAVAGTPGTGPTGWFISTAAGITRELVGTGTENGITYIDYRFSGTATGNTDTQFIAGSFAPAASGQTWTVSNYAKIVAGSLTNVTVTQLNIEYDGSGTFLAASAQNITPTTAALSGQRFALTRTFSNPSAGNAGFVLRLASAGAIDITLRIGLPQLEQGAFATSVIPTTTTALTRSADVASVNTLSPWFNATEGTFVASAVMNGSVSTQNTVWRVDNTTDNERMFVRSNSSLLQFAGIAGGSTQWDLRTGNTLTLGAQFNSASAYKVNDIANAFNGGNLLTDTSATIPTATRVLLGGDNGGGYLNGYIRRITYYPRRLSNAELQAITA